MLQVLSFLVGEYWKRYSGIGGRCRGIFRVVCGCIGCLILALRRNNLGGLIKRSEPMVFLVEYEKKCLVYLQVSNHHIFVVVQKIHHGALTTDFKDIILGHKAFIIYWDGCNEGTEGIIPELLSIDPVHLEVETS